ncbi:hypothetical protein ACR9GP_25670 [Enterobacter ludwigii]
MIMKYYNVSDIKIFNMLKSDKVVFCLEYSGMNINGLDTKYPIDKWLATFESGDVVRTFDFHSGIDCRRPLSAADAEKIFLEVALVGTIPPYRAYGHVLSSGEYSRDFLIAPSPGKILYCLMVGTWAATDPYPLFCTNYGYSQDNINAAKIYSHCRQTSEDLHALFPQGMFDKLETLLANY